MSFWPVFIWGFSHVVLPLNYSSGGVKFRARQPLRSRLLFILMLPVPAAKPRAT